MSLVNYESALRLRRFPGVFDRPASGWSSSVDSAPESGVGEIGVPVRHRR